VAPEALELALEVLALALQVQPLPRLARGVAAVEAAAAQLVAT
jgi:hypothetical protein